MSDIQTLVAIITNLQNFMSEYPDAQVELVAVGLGADQAYEHEFQSGRYVVRVGTAAIDFVLEGTKMNEPGVTVATVKGAADAALIAAAPELLAALQQVVALYDDYDLQVGSYPGATKRVGSLDGARAAIAKALGN